MSYGKKIFLTTAIAGSLFISSGVLAENVSSTADASGSTTTENSITIDLNTSSFPTEQDAATEAQAAEEANQAVNLDENTAAASQQPKLLSDSPFYFLKNWSRGIQSLFNFDPAKKAELQLKFSSEKLAEAKELLNRQKNARALEMIQSSNEDFEKAKQLAVGQNDSQKTDRILEKMAQKTIENQKTLDLLTNDLSPDNQAAVENAKEEMVKKYLSAENPEKLQERLRNALSNQQGSEFKDVKNLQILQSLKDAAPEEMKQKIEELSGELMNKLNEKLASLPPEKAQVLESYLGSLKGGDVQSLYVALLLKDQNISTTTLEKIKNAEEKIAEKLGKRLEQGQGQNSQIFINKIIESLGNGEFKNLKILTELTDNASSTTLSRLLDAQSKARENMLKKMESLPEDQRQQMMDNIVSESDLKTLKALTDNSDSLSEDRKQKIGQLSEKIQSLIKTKLSGATSSEELQKIIDKVSSGDVKDVQTLKDLLKDSPVIKEIINGVLNSIISRLRSIKDPTDIENLQQEILGNSSVESTSSLLFQELDSIKQKLRSKMTPDQIASAITEAEVSLSQLETSIQSNKNALDDSTFKSLDSMTKNAKKEIEIAKQFFDMQKFEEAQVRITSARTRISGAAMTFRKSLQPKSHNGETTTTDKVLCPTLWDPVCGKDGKTYSNDCVAKNTGKTEVDHKGSCEKINLKNATTSATTDSSSPNSISPNADQ